MNLSAHDPMVRWKNSVLLHLILLIFITSDVQAQFIERLHLSSGLQAALPVKEFRSFASFGVGVHGQVEYPLSTVFSMVGTIGWSRFFGKDYGNGKTKGMSAFPFLVGGRLHVTKKWFGGALAGAGFMTAGGSSETTFLCVPQIGYSLKRAELILGFHATSGRSGYDHTALVCLFKF
jgi:multisubunit Na+/H+ antiporter MnhG subunit